MFPSAFHVVHWLLQHPQFPAIAASYGFPPMELNIRLLRDWKQTDAGLRGVDGGLRDVHFDSLKELTNGSILYLRSLSMWVEQYAALEQGQRLNPVLVPPARYPTDAAKRGEIAKWLVGDFAEAEGCVARFKLEWCENSVAFISEVARNRFSPINTDGVVLPSIHEAIRQQIRRVGSVVERHCGRVSEAGVAFNISSFRFDSSTAKSSPAERLTSSSCVTRCQSTPLVNRRWTESPTKWLLQRRLLEVRDTTR